ncbi:hypothetical protein D3C78_1968320 [compost metagenome]
MAMKLISTPTGIESTITSALLRWNRNAITTRLTISTSSISASRSVATAPSIRSDRS